MIHGTMRDCDFTCLLDKVMTVWDQKFPFFRKIILTSQGPASGQFNRETEGNPRKSCSVFLYIGKITAKSQKICVFQLFYL
jgi:hypothetical protein